ncbi:MAG: DUF4252 domain-containing protein [Bacteroidales bacterium]|jgi:hypothetical protein|nr:DUF4252 domain-containing protein [Bacteroidales bacterium]MBQ2492262.1 DUF4252 domain-containing protein [Bacteroidales bacterium]MBQ3978392.1 DUF4252 domain-containing protein [Bacteroidales bacterium]
MKKISLIIIALMASIAMQAQDYKSLYQKYSDDERVTAVYISPAMFKLIGKLPEVKIEDNGVDFGPMIKSMTGFYLLQTEDKDLADKIFKDVSKVVNGHKFETLMEVKDKGERVNVFSLGDKNFLKSLLFTAFQGNETTFISIDGLIKRDDVENAIGAAAKDLL